MKTLVLLATILAFCTMQTLAKYSEAIPDTFQEMLENVESLIFDDEEPKKREVKGVRKFSGWFFCEGEKYPMSLAAGFDMENGLMEGEARVEKRLLKDSFSVAGTIQSNGKVKFYAVSKKEPEYTYIGMYKEGKIKGTFTLPIVDGGFQLKKTGSDTWEGTFEKGPGEPTIPYTIEEFHLNVDENGILTATGKDKDGKFMFTGPMDSNNNVEIVCHYLHAPDDTWTEKGKFNKEMTVFKGTLPAKKFHGSFELTEE